MIHQLKLQHGGMIEIKTVGSLVLLQVQNKAGVIIEQEITVQDLEELADLSMDSFYKAQLETKKPREEVPHV